MPSRESFWNALADRLTPETCMRGMNEVGRTVNDNVTGNTGLPPSFTTCNDAPNRVLNALNQNKALTPGLERRYNAGNI
jgi:hypothetical protein